MKLDNPNIETATLWQELVYERKEDENNDDEIDEDDDKLRVWSKGFSCTGPEIKSFYKRERKYEAEDLENTMDPDSFDFIKEQFEDWCIDEAKKTEYDEDYKDLDWDDDDDGKKEVEDFLNKKY